MDRETMSQYGWIIVALLILSVVLSFTTPLFGMVSSKIADIPDRIVGAAINRCPHEHTTDRYSWESYDLTQHIQRKETVCDDCGKIISRSLTGIKEDHDFSESDRCPQCGKVHSHYFATEVARRYEQIPFDYTMHNCIITKQCTCGAEREYTEKWAHTFVDDVCDKCGYDNNAFIYEVRFDPNKKYPSDTVTNIPDTIPKKRNVDIPIPNTVPVYEGYDFGGWATSPEGAAVYQVGDEFGENRSITLYAVWNHTHVFNQQVASSQYFCSPANCLDRALYYKSCLCGESSKGKVGETKFPYGETGNHIWSTEPSTQNVMNPLYYRDGTNEGEITPAIPYFETEWFGDVIEAWHSSYGEYPEGLMDMGSISPCIYCGGHKMKSAKLYSVNRTSCTICHIANTGFVFVWECYDCGNTNTQQFPIAHSEHTYGAWTIVTPATCTAAGQEKRVCTLSDCDAYETRTISPLGHRQGDYVRTKVESTSCTSAGIKEYRCTRCGELFDVTYYLDHEADTTEDPIKFGNWEYRQDHHLTYYPCKWCGAEVGTVEECRYGRNPKYKIIDGVNHYIYYRCPDCGYIIEKSKQTERCQEDSIVTVSHDNECLYCKKYTLTVMDINCSWCHVMMRQEFKCENLKCAQIWSDNYVGTFYDDGIWP